MKTTKCRLNKPMLLISLFLLFASSSLAYGNNSFAARKDSLLQRIDTLQNPTLRMYCWLDLAQLTIGTDECFFYLSRLEQDALKYGNIAELHNAYINMVAHYAGKSCLIDSFLDRTNAFKAFFLEHKSYDYYFEAECFIISEYLSKGSYALALEYAESMLDYAMELDSREGEISAYENMGLAYFYANRKQEARSAWEKGYSLLSQYFPERQFYRMDYLFYLISVTYDLGHYTTSLSHCYELWRAIDLFEQNKQGTPHESMFMEDYKMRLNGYYARNYVKKGDLKQAKEALDQAETYLQYEMNEIYIQELNMAYASYYQATAQYPLAIHHLDEALSFFKENSITEYLSLQDQKAELLADMNRYDEAYKLAKQTKEATDSLSTDALTRQISELRTIHQVYTLEAEAEKSRLHAQILGIIISALTLLVILLILILLYVRYNAKRLKEKNQKLFEQLQWQNEQRKEAEELSLKLSESLADAGKTADGSKSHLFLQAQKYLLETQRYLEADLTREHLALQVGTNRQYLCDAIQEETGLTFNDYINNLRLIHAKDLLMNNKNQTIEEIFLYSGFSTKSTFYRLFRKKYGLTPTEIREMMTEKS
ncbi:helix-turn-helix domain-containing protein, partial [Parabacteroides sp. OttesenSCG-928-J18]|nr:helix-turn-helix domain-containing protein [Parabacteroides sp. OttesenSCG-928-J18]